MSTGLKKVHQSRLVAYFTMVLWIFTGDKMDSDTHVILRAISRSMLLQVSSNRSKRRFPELNDM